MLIGRKIPTCKHDRRIFRLTEVRRFHLNEVLSSNQLVAAGFHVILRARVKQITGAGGKAIAVGADVSKVPEVEAMVAAASKLFGGADVLVNNAGELGVY